MTTLETAADTILTDEMLARFDERAPGYDRENRFFQEDFDELRAAGYLDLAAHRVRRRRPDARGGEPAAAPPRLRRAGHRRRASTCTSTGSAVAADLHRAGDPSCDWMLEEAADGHVFAAGHGEAGNDLPAAAVDDEGRAGRRRLGDHRPQDLRHPLAGVDLPRPARHGHERPGEPEIVHGFLDRDAPRYRIEETWDTLGMRATMSNDTILDRTFIPDEHVALVCPAGFAGAGLFQVALFAWALLGFAGVYAGIAQRAFDETVEPAARAHVDRADPLDGVPPRRAALRGRDAHRPRGDRRPPRPDVDDWSNGVDHGMDVAAEDRGRKYDVVNRAWSVVDTAFDLTGGSGIFKRSRFEQLFRDARLGRIHPGNSLLTHELVGKMSLGINPDEQPRWG